LPLPFHRSSWYPEARRRPGGAAARAALALALATPAAAQTDYYNTDRARPITIEDAYATERYSFELQVAPLRFARGPGTRQWGVEPELAYGVLPRTHIEVGLPLVLPMSGQRGGPRGLELAVLHNLNVETTGVPALAVGADLLAPVGRRAPNHAYATATVLATRTLPWARFHLNAGYTFGPSPGAAGSAGAPGTLRREEAEVPRWLAGVAIDRAFPLRALLVTGDLVARRPLERKADLDWIAEGGLRLQLDPKFSLDAGVGRHLAGSAQSWFVTLGVARTFALRALMP
jgi:hypothetical protein